jgi:hypothetical protein
MVGESSIVNREWVTASGVKRLRSASLIHLFSDSFILLLTSDS